MLFSCFGTAGFPKVKAADFSVGIAGYVFSRNEMINCEDAYTYPLFNSDVDKATGTHPQVVEQ